jgi:hypothetical protein
MVLTFSHTLRRIALEQLPSATRYPLSHALVLSHVPLVLLAGRVGSRTSEALGRLPLHGWEVVCINSRRV